MSFMGSIGSMMKGSGLEEALETVYGPNAVIHMLSGKAVSRALRGHFLVEAALVNKLMLAVLPHPEEEADLSLVEEIEGMKLHSSLISVRWYRKSMICTKELKTNLYQFLILLKQRS